MPAPTQRRSLGALFLLLTIVFVGIAWAAAVAGGSAWVIAVAAGAIAAWLASMAYRGLRPN